MVIYSRRATAFAAVMAMAAMVGTAAAQVPTQIPVQGFLTDLDGQVVDGPTSMVFALYLSTSPAEAGFWTETQTVEVRRGFFSAYLGKARALDPSAFADTQDVFVGVSVAGGAEMGRIRVASTAFAFYAEHAGDAQTLAGLTPQAFARSDVACKPGEVMRGVTVMGQPSCVADNDTKYSGAMFALSDQRCAVGMLVTGVTATGQLECADADLSRYGCEDGEHLVYDTASSDWRCGVSSFESAPASVVTSDDIAHWRTAYAWGDHAAAGYLTDEVDPHFAQSPAAGVTATRLGHWDAAYGWGDHAAAGYLTDEADPHFAQSPAAGVGADDIARWDLASEQAASVIASWSWLTFRTRTYDTRALITHAHAAAACVDGQPLFIDVPDLAFGKTGHALCALNTVESARQCSSLRHLNATPGGTVITSQTTTPPWGDCSADGGTRCGCVLGNTPVWPWGWNLVSNGVATTDVSDWHLPQTWVVCCGP